MIKGYSIPRDFSRTENYKLSESNDKFDDESSLESSGSYNSEEEPCFCGMGVNEIQENDQQVCFKNYYFCSFSWYR